MASQPRPPASRRATRAPLAASGGPGLQCRPAIREWLDFLATLLAQVAREEHEPRNGGPSSRGERASGEISSKERMP